MRTKWDAAKNKAVQKKHGISFEEAKQVFRDVTASFGGELISEKPDQFVIIGFSNAGTLITIVYEFRSDEGGEYIWLVTLWETTKAEKRRFKI